MNQIWNMWKLWRRKNAKCVKVFCEMQKRKEPRSDWSILRCHTPPNKSVSIFIHPVSPRRSSDVPEFILSKHSVKAAIFCLFSALYFPPGLAPPTIHLPRVWKGIRTRWPQEAGPTPGWDKVKDGLFSSVGVHWQDRDAECWEETLVKKTKKTLNLWLTPCQKKNG